MFEPATFLVNLTLCAAALGFAAFVRKGRAEAVIVALMLLVNFLFCAMAYTQYAPKYVLAEAGIPVSSKDLWMLSDAVFGAMALLVAFTRPWAWALWFMAVAQVAIHAAYQAGLFSALAYSDWLAVVLHAQLAVFFMIGGRGLGNYLLLHIDRLRNPRRSVDARACDKASGPR